MGIGKGLPKEGPGDKKDCPLRTCSPGLWLRMLGRAQLTPRFGVRVRRDTKSGNSSLVVWKGPAKGHSGVSKGLSPEIFSTWAMPAILC